MCLGGTGSVSLQIINLLSTVPLDHRGLPLALLRLSYPGPPATHRKPAGSGGETASTNTQFCGSLIQDPRPRVLWNDDDVHYCIGERLGLMSTETVMATYRKPAGSGGKTASTNTQKTVAATTRATHAHTTQ